MRLTKFCMKTRFCMKMLKATPFVNNIIYASFAFAYLLHQCSHFVAVLVSGQLERTMPLLTAPVLFNVDKQPVVNTVSSQIRAINVNQASCCESVKYIIDMESSIDGN